MQKQDLVTAIGCVAFGPVFGPNLSLEWMQLQKSCCFAISRFGRKGSSQRMFAELASYLLLLGPEALAKQTVAFECYSWTTSPWQYRGCSDPGREEYSYEHRT